MSKVQNAKFNITVAPCKLYVKSQMSKITKRHFKSVQMSFQC